MSLRFLGIAVMAGGLLAAVPPRAPSRPDPGSCPSDSKLVNGGPTRVFGDGPGTWWGLIVEGLNAAGLDEPSEQIAYLNGVFGTSYTTLAQLKALNLQLVSDGFDENQNGYICAFELRGTRAYLGDPFVNLTHFGISDDRIAKD
jgi:hypothetical protein